MNNDEPFKPNDRDELLEMLERLQVIAPANTQERLRRRIRTFQLGRDLLEKQVYGFWIVLHAFLTVAFRFFSSPPSPRKQRKTF